ncbi:hypothetical protein DVH24_017880 [Malus domestica]|uniref:Uncharacterized protein n=1 Tax=Malus domestica TaxID=3750 RepID=A0A498KE21_MALDO|nr:hypothetical protein DVH24_017880 [Malus domestica]
MKLVEGCVYWIILLLFVFVFGLLALAHKSGTNTPTAPFYDLYEIVPYISLLPTSPCPNRITLRKSSHLLGPKFPQIAWVIDVTKFLVEDFTRNSSSRDGHGEVAAEEYSHIPATPDDDVVPGTKIKLAHYIYNEFGSFRSRLTVYGSKPLKYLVS